MHFSDHTEIDVLKETWDNIRYKWDANKKKVIEEPIGTFIQYPVKLAWAITVHKSQGLTFEKVIADVGESFAHGQVYVALSRCTSFKGLLLRTQLTSRSVKTDPLVLEFASNETPGTILLKELEKSKKNYNLKAAVQAWKNGEYQLATESLLLYLEEKDADTNRAIKLCDEALYRYINTTTKVINQVIMHSADVNDNYENTITVKKNDKSLRSILKEALLKGQAISNLLEDLSDYQLAEELIARHGNNIDMLIETIKKVRKLVNVKGKHAGSI